ncbi:hypothetical protein PHYC_03710 [Phycisphaerales bacterium]|nr:hypothetical protein PHYC_03710 [Phycisphaerales bacterium]
MTDWTTHVFDAATLAQNVTPEQAAQSGRSLLEYIRQGGFLGYVLIALSVAAVTLVILSLIKVRKDAWAPLDVVQALTKYLREHDVEGAKAYCADPNNECFVTRVIGNALARCGRSAFGFLELRSALEESGQIEADRQYRVNDGLQLIAALGPMLGLLGTVIGLIGAFSSLADLEGAARSKALAGFMSLALVNTAEGLAVAIPCTAFYFLFKRRIDRLATEVGGIVEGIAIPLEQRQGGEKPAPKPAPRPMARPAPAAPGPVPVEPSRGVPTP